MLGNFIHQENESDKTAPHKVVVKCLFLDYDGTISPLNVPRNESEVPEEIREVLQQIGRLIPIVIVSTKDLSFLVQRTSFAYAWSAISGLEKRIGKEILKPSSLKQRLKHISLALKYARSHITDVGIYIEEKRDSTGRTIAFCVDWRQARNAEIAEFEANLVATYCKMLSLELIRYEGQPFYDVYPVSVDKGRALKEIQKKLKLENGILYMGDSEIDNPAFEASDVSIGVINEGSPFYGLVCDYFVKFEEVADFLSMLLANHLLFSSDFPMIRINSSRRKYY